MNLATVVWEAGADAMPSAESYVSTVHLLAWKDAPKVSTFCRALSASDLIFRAEELRVALELLSVSSPSSRGLISEVMHLPGTGLVRVLGAPETLAQLVLFHQGYQHEFLEFLSGVILAERCRSERLIPEQTQWTALGDFCFRPTGHPYIAQLVDGIVVDCRSPYGRNSKGRPSVVQFNAPPSVDTDTACTKVMRALALIAYASPATHSFIHGGVQTILLREKQPSPELFNSASSRPFTGRILLLNANQAWVDEARVSSAIIHEATHSFFYRLERQNPPLLLADSGLRECVVSPWSGNPLRLLTYVHACFVYHGLRFFWSLPSAAVLFGPTAAAEWMDFTMKGFYRDEFWLRIVPFRKALNPQILEALAFMREDLS